jgi:hypothetical protein
MGGGGSRCTKNTTIDKKPEVSADVGITIAGSKQCNNCNLSVAVSSSSSVINLTRDNTTSGILLLEPTVPLSVNFNGTTAVFNQVALYAPAPTSVEQVNADMVLECRSDQLRLFIPLKASDSGDHIGFLSAIAGALDPTTENGLGIVDSSTGKYRTAIAPTGQDWSIAKLVDGVRDPYFTWVNGKLTQYTIYDSECFSRIGWKASAGPTIIYFQNSIDVSSADVTKIRNTIGVVSPQIVGLTINNTLYYPGESNCGAPLPKLKLPIFQPNSSFTDYALYFGIILIAFLAVVAAVSLAMMKDGPIQMFAGGISRLFGSFPKANRVPGPMPGLAAAIQNPTALKDAVQGKANTGLASMINSGLAKMNLNKDM